MSQATTAKEVLVAARWLLVNHGWQQGSMHSQNNGKHFFCSVGAIMNVEADKDLLIKAKRLLSENLPKSSMATDSGIVIWNDQISRTKKQVLALFDKTIKGAK